MNRQFFTLRPFCEDAENAPDIRITGSIARGPEAPSAYDHCFGQCARRERGLSPPELGGHKALPYTGQKEDQGPLVINYQIAGKCAAIDLPEAAGTPERRDFLWKATCFELFIKEMGAEGYLEINLSPAGHWNIYRFDGYRTGMREEMRVAAPMVHVDNRKPDIWNISTGIHIDSIMAASRPILAAVSAVVKTVAGHLSYWALTHPGPEPDFHHRDGFAIRL